MPLRSALLAALVLAVTPGGAAAAVAWSPPRAVTSSGAAFEPAVAVGTRGTLGVAYVHETRGERRIELRRGSAKELGRTVVLDRARRVDSPALTFAGGTTVAAWIRQRASNRGVWWTRVPAGAGAGTPRQLGGPPHQYEPRFPAPDALLFNTRATATVSPVTSGGTIGAGVKLPRGATFDATVAALPDGSRVAAWSERGVVFTAREATGASGFGAPTRLSDPGKYARSPQLAVTTDGHAVAVWTQSHVLESASLAPGAAAFGAPQELALATAGVDAPRAIATTAGDVLVAYVSAPDGALAGALDVLRLRPDGRAATSTKTLTATGERTRAAALAVDSSAGWVAWATAGTGRHAVRMARVAPGLIVSAPRTVSGSDSVVSAPPAIAMDLSSRGVIAWATTSGRIHAVTRSGF
ncbi:MAG: hypothetical protein ACXVFN_01735 [Solirubrobacteraceae bacterium]